MGSNNNVHAAHRQAEKDITLLLWGSEAREHFDFYGVGSQSLPEGVEVLLCKNCGRHKEGNLFTIHNGFKCRAQGDLCFAITNVAADQAVHWTGFFHVVLDFVKHSHLIIGFYVGETGFQFLLPWCIYAKSMTG